MGSIVRLPNAIGEIVSREVGADDDVSDQAVALTQAVNNGSVVNEDLKKELSLTEPSTGEPARMDDHAHVRASSNGAVTNETVTANSQVAEAGETDCDRMKSSDN